ncbi:hypothetical protein L2E82_45831 [Cichorium intybus]|uniref:Uncharacterized protein n=1 Tax=Cichorium intybus TaxID=13427 RepID=A0ACB8ZUM2_CICIN|nr:hypothetical protein L2E82_45831 [Cichorium intybus]
MAFIGRGHGRGGFGYGRFAKKEKYEVFPEINKLPNVNLKQKDEELTQKDKELMSLARCSDKLIKFWRSSPYFLEDPSVDGKKDESRIKRPPLSDFMMTTSGYLPSDLAGKNESPIKKKKTQWDLQSDGETEEKVHVCNREEGCGLKLGRYVAVLVFFSFKPFDWKF